MEEVLRLYNIITEGIDTPEDTVLRMNDVLGVYLLLVKKAFEIQKDDKKRAMICDSIKAMQNNLITEVMKAVSEAEMKTIDNDKWSNFNTKLQSDEVHIW